MNETISLLGNLAEILGSVAVLITLIYLAVQVRQGREAIERNEKIILSQVHQARTDTRVEMLVSQASLATPAMEAVMNNPQNLDNLTLEELTVFRNLQRAGIAVQDNVLYQYGLGLLDEQTLLSTNDVIMRFYNVWQLLEIPITERIKDWHATKCQEIDA